VPSRKSTKRPPTRKGLSKDPGTRSRPRPPFVRLLSHFLACAPPRAVLPTSPEFQQHLIRRLGLLADDAAALSDRLWRPRSDGGINELTFHVDESTAIAFWLAGVLTDEAKADELPVPEHRQPPWGPEYRWTSAAWALVRAHDARAREARAAGAGAQR
jgi:hypothetical protein